jgi:hypothetical protein
MAGGEGRQRREGLLVVGGERGRGNRLGRLQLSIFFFQGHKANRLLNHSSANYISKLTNVDGHKTHPRSNAEPRVSTAGKDGKDPPTPESLVRYMTVTEPCFDVFERGLNPSDFL